MGQRVPRRLRCPALPFRRGGSRSLARGESVHWLACIINNGPIRHDRGRRRDERIMICGALTWLRNAVLAYNAWKPHQVLERRKADGGRAPPDEILTHIASVAFRHINFHDVDRLPLERHGDRSLPCAPGR
jgi:hypothetical protein